MSTYPSMMRHMIGKKDKAGRLPQAPLVTEYWSKRADEETDIIIQFIGREKYHTFIQALPPQADEWSERTWVMALSKAHAFVAMNYLNLSMPDLIKATLASIVPQQVSL